MYSISITAVVGAVGLFVRTHARTHAHGYSTFNDVLRKRR